MASIDDAIREAQQGNLTFDNNINVNSGGLITIDEAIKGAQNNYIVTPSENDNPLYTLYANTAAPFAIGAANMVNDTVLGGSGLILGNLGRGVEAISPFSGRDEELATYLSKWGANKDYINQVAPYRDSWLTSASKGVLGVHNYVSDALDSYEQKVIGDNPNAWQRNFRGAGSVLGFLATGALAHSNPLLSALLMGGSEALAEAGSFYADAYRNGQDMDKALWTANKSLAANTVLNTGLNFVLSPFGKLAGKIDPATSPYKRYIVESLLEGLLNEPLQETSQQTIEKAAQDTLQGNNGFMSNLGERIKEWPQNFMEIAPETATSTLLAELLFAPFRLHTFNKARTRMKPRAQTEIDAENNQQYEDLKRQREDLQKQVDNIIYNPYPADMDSQLDTAKALSDLSARLQNIDDRIANFWGESEINLFPDESDNTGNDRTPPPTTPPSAPTNGQTESPNAAQDSGLMPPISGLQDNQATPKTKPKRDLLPEEQQLTIPDNNPLSPDNPDDNDLPPITALRTPSSETKPANSQEQQPIAPSQSDTATLMPPITGLRNDNNVSIQATSLAQQNGNTARVRTMQGTEADVRYRVVEADDLNVSTLENGALNPAYPQDMQPRQRNREASRQQVERMSNSIDPELLGENRLASDGAPIVGNDLVVESGNGRVMGLKQAYKKGKAENYRSWLKKNAANFGLNSDEIAKMKNPVLVRKRISDVDRIKFTREANESSTAQMSASENAVNDAKKLTTAMLSDYDANKPLAGNKSFIQSFLGLISQNERGNLLQSDGKISRSGLERITNALIAKAYNNVSIINRLSEVFDDDIKNVSNALIQAAPKIAVLQNSGIRQEHSISEDIMQAANILVNLRQEGRTVSEYLAAQDLFNDVTPEAKKLLKFFDDNKRSAKRMAQGLINYAEGAMNEAKEGQATLFADSVRTKGQILDEAIKSAQNESESYNQSMTINHNGEAQELTIEAKEFDRKYSRHRKIFGRILEIKDKAGRVVARYSPYTNTFQMAKEFKDDKELEQSIFSELDRNYKSYLYENKLLDKRGNLIDDSNGEARSEYLEGLARKRQKKQAAEKTEDEKKEKETPEKKTPLRERLKQAKDDAVDYVLDTPHRIHEQFKDWVSETVAPFKRKGRTVRRAFDKAAEKILSRYDDEQTKKLISDVEKILKDLRELDKEQGINKLGYLTDSYIKPVARLIAYHARFYSSYYGISPKAFLELRGFKIDYNTDYGETFIKNTKTQRRGDNQYKFKPRDKNGNIISEASNFITLLQTSDASTLIHELGHVFLNNYRDLMRTGRLQGVAKHDWKTILKWLGVEDLDLTQNLYGEDQARWTDAEEKFAAGFEKYIMTGKAPSMKLRHAFDLLKRWMYTAYRAVKSIMYAGSDGKAHEFELSPEIEAVYGRIFTDVNKDEVISEPQGDLSGNDENDSYNQPLNNDVDLDAEVNIVKDKPILPRVQAWQRKKSFPKQMLSEIVSRFKNEKVINEHTGLIVTLSENGLDHILNTARNSSDDAAGRTLYQAIPYLDTLVKEAYRVETHKDRKPSATKLEGQLGNLRQVHRFLVPVDFGEGVHILKLTAKEYETGKAEVDEVSLYDMKNAKKMSHPPIPDSPDLTGRATRTAGNSDVISVRDMIKDVNDADGNPYYSGDSSENYTQPLNQANSIFEDLSQKQQDNFIFLREAQNILSQGQFNNLLNDTLTTGFRRKFLNWSKAIQNNTPLNENQAPSEKTQQRFEENLRAFDESKRKDGFMGERQLEKFNQMALYATSNILWGNHFDLQYVKANEGFAKYGHGVYLQSNPETAEKYRTYGRDREVNQVFNDFIDNVNNNLAQGVKFKEAIDSARNETEQKINELQREINSLFRDFTSSNDDTIARTTKNSKSTHKTKLIKNIKQLNALKNNLWLINSLSTLEDFNKLEKKRGNVYKIDIPEDSELLNWNLPLFQQPRQVQERLKNMLNDLAKMGWAGSKIYQKAFFSDLSGIDITQGRAGNITGGMLYQNIMDFMKDKVLETMSPEQRREAFINHDKNVTPKTKVRTSQIFNEYGIPGHRYSEKNSGAYSYVIWNTDKLKMVGITPDSDKNAIEVFKNGGQRPEAERYNQQVLNASEDNLTPEARKQMEQVRKQYQGTDKWLKAPNGKKSNLTEKQWVQVRTQNFKNWFGDWENDPANASQVLDENGEPKIVYHGTLHEPFSIFNTEGGSAGMGSFFTDALYDAEGYSGHGKGYLYPVFLNIHTPYIFDEAYGKNWNNLDTFIIRDFENDDYIYTDEFGNNFADKDEAEDYIADTLNDPDFIRYAVEPKYSYNTTDEIVNAAFKGELDGSPEGYYDGVIFDGIIDGHSERPSTVYVVRYSEDIKSSTRNNGNFSQVDGDIYHQRALNSDEQQFTPEALKQVERVRKKYEGTEQWLKAPNGKKSNLNETQWLLVRTPNFKRWFGDWENHPEHASKALDINGEPLVVYHGTIVPDIETFKRSVKGWLGPAIYLTPYKNYANEYTKRADKGVVMELFLNVRNPLVVKTTNPIMELLNILYGDKAEAIFNERYEKIRTRELENFNQNLKNGKIKGAVDQNLDRIIKRYIITDDELQKILEQGNYDGISWFDPEELQELMSSTDYDGVNFYNTEYAVLNSTQIKSATGNNGNFNGSDTDIYHQIIGKQGAKELDTREGVNSRMDNLRIAQQMERDGETAKKMWLATGWMRGVDGKWRYELPDGKFTSSYRKAIRRITPQSLEDFEVLKYKAQGRDYYTEQANEEAAYKELEQISDTVDNINEFVALRDKIRKKYNLPPVNFNPPLDFSLLSPKEQKHFYFLEDTLQGTTLRDVLNAPELFDAYPDLTIIPVYIEKLAEDDIYGAYYASKNNIVINIEHLHDTKELRRTLIHEVQHAIQNIEGFARGSNETMFKTNSKGEVNIKPFLRKNLKRQEKLIFDNLPQDIQKIFRSLKEKGSSLSPKEFSKLLKNSLNSNYQKRYKEWRRVQNLLTGINENRLKDYPTKYDSPYKAYLATAGEVEARNAADRSNWGEKRRRNTPLNESEFEGEGAKFAPEFQLVIDNRGNARREAERYNQAVQTSLIDNSEAQQQLEDVRKKYQGTSQWMKAPNGKDTNLNEQQWLQVRTPKFKAWFGDWENDPKHASKVVDENGEPMVVWHGYRGDKHKGFSVFHISGGTEQTTGTGAYFSSKRKGSEFYIIGKPEINQNLYPCFLNIRNPYEHDAQGRYWAGLGKVWIEGKNGEKIFNKQNGEPFLSEYEAYDYLRDVLHDDENYEVLHDEELNTTDDIIRSVWSKKLGKGNHDGVIFKDVCDPYERIDEFITRTPENIKSATDNNGNFDINNRDIYHQAYNPQNDRNIQALLERNRKAQPEFIALMHELQTKLGGELITRKGLKSPERILLKANRLFRGDVSRVGDVLAATLVYDNEDDLLDALIKLKQRDDLVHIENRWNKPKRSTGYRDVISHLKLSDGTVVELQLQHDGIQNVKDNIGHLLYEFMTNNRGNYELSDLIWQTGDLSKRLYAAGLDGTYQALNSRKKNSLKSLGENLAHSSSVQEAQEAISKLEDFINENLQESSSIGDNHAPMQKSSLKIDTIADKYIHETRRSIVVPVERIHLTENVSSLSIERAKRNMQRALNGFMSKREPLTVRLRSDGEYDVLDGNNTLSALRELGAKNVPVEVIGERKNDRVKSAVNNNEQTENYYQIGTRRKNEMNTALIKSRPDMNAEQRKNAIDEIEKLGESVRQGGYPKVEKIATKWLLDGHIILPEDNYKILDAIKICEQQHLDPMSFDDPNKILAQYTIKETKADRRINPDNVPEFSNKVEYPNGITVYNVEDTEEGQAAVRSIIDTHWGEDANPWCLAARTEAEEIDEYDDEGEYLGTRETEHDLSQAWKYWNHYNGIDKRIAFYNGKLTAFCASEDEENTWWNREDTAHYEGIPYTVKKHGVTYEYIYNEKTGKSIKVMEELADGTIHTWYENGNKEYEKLPDGTYHSWYENGKDKEEKLLDKTRRAWYENGNKKEEELPNGTSHSWYENGQLKSENLPDNTYRSWYEDGKPRHERLSDGTRHDWLENGNMQYEKLTDGTIREWYENGNPKREELPDRTNRRWYENGNQEYEDLPDGTKRRWYENGNPKEEDLPDGTSRDWYKNGQLKRETLPDGTYHYFYEDGKPQREKLPDGTKREWYEDGTPQEEELPDGTYRTWYENGNMEYEKLPDGTIHKWYENGNQQREHLPDGTTRKWYENGSRAYEELPGIGTRTWHENGKQQGEYLRDGTRRHWYENGNQEYEFLPDETERRWYENGELRYEYLPKKTKTQSNEDSERYHQTTNDQQERSNEAIDYFNNYKQEHPDGFITPEVIERFNQLRTHATGNIILGNKFDLAYAGSSEGSSFYGHGAYFEESPEVAEIYRRYGLTKNEKIGNIRFFMRNGEEYSGDNSSLGDNEALRDVLKDVSIFSVKNPNEKWQNIHDYLESFYNDDIDAMKSSLPYLGKSKKDKQGINKAKRDIEFVQQKINALNEIKGFSVSERKNGNIYQFDIPEDYELLDWDAPLSKQPKQVKQRIKLLINEFVQRGYATEKELTSYPTQVSLGSIDKNPNYSGEITGGMLYQNVVNITQRMIDTLSPKKSGIINPKVSASELFNSAGIPGHRFLDRGSRNTKTGTHNYVIWNMSKVKMVDIDPTSDKEAIDYFNRTKQQQENGFINSAMLETYNQDAYHGTGNIILNNKFDLQYKGSNEGTAVFGHGAYLAQNKATPEHYRRFGLSSDTRGQLTITTENGNTFKSQGVGQWDNEPDTSMLNVLDDIDSLVRNSKRTPKIESIKKDIAKSYRRELREAKRLLAQAKHNLRIFGSVYSIEIKYRQDNINFINKKIDALNSISSFSIDERKGNIYKFDVPEDEELLNWDAPLSQQSPLISKAIKQALVFANRSPDAIVDKFSKLADNPEEAKPLIQAAVNSALDSFNTNFFDAYSSMMSRYKVKYLKSFSPLQQIFTDRQLDNLVEAIIELINSENLDENNSTGEDLYRALAFNLGSDEAASDYLNNLGIPGHRFWDAWSRDKQQGTHNFVIWNMDKLKMLAVEGDKEAEEYFRKIQQAQQQGNSSNTENFLQPQQLEHFNQLMYHGSKNILLGNRFNLKYLSTGEGGQAFGYGSYLGQVKDTGEYYRTAGMPRENYTFKNRRGQEISLQDVNDKLITASYYLHLKFWDAVDFNAVINDIKKCEGMSKAQFKTARKEIINKHVQSFIENAKKEKIHPNVIKDVSNYLYRTLGTYLPVEIVKIEKTNGNLYYVDGPEDFELLDWDAKISEQPEQVYNALKRGGLIINEDETGEQLYRRLQKQFKEEHNSWDKAEMLTSQKLNELGIPGHRFWDRVSRNAKSGTHNYVIWNTDTLRLLGLSEDSEQDAQDYFRAEDLRQDELDSLDNDSDVLEYSSVDDMNRLDEYARDSLDAQDDDGFSEIYHQAEIDNSEAIRQLQEVRRKYQGSKNWLKAPNGKDTNLTEQQWLQVRTENFKRWFGDWENNPDNSSKILDENGEPMVVWHGGRDNSFRKFDKRRISKRSDNIKGFYFAPPSRRDSLAGYYTRGKERAFFLNIRNPLINYRPGSPDFSLDEVKAHDGMIAISGEDWNTGGYYNYRLEKLEPEQLKKGDIIEIVAFEPEQIKSTTDNNGNFNAKDRDVYHQPVLEYNEINDRFADFEEFYNTDGEQVHIEIAQEQLDAVRRKYENSTQWMKAPNDKKTHLTEKQWLQVRTPNFKKWFGDWEKAPKNASKVVDENGEPLVVYHGTDGYEPFSTFNDDKYGKGVEAIYFTSSIPMAQSYGPVIPSFLNIRNPFTYDCNDKGQGNLEQVYILDKKTNEKILSWQDGTPFYDREDAYNCAFYELTDEDEEYNSDRFEVLFDDNYKFTEDIIQAVWNGELGDGNHDGIILKNIRDYTPASGLDFPADEFILRGSDNIKSATRNDGNFGVGVGDIYHQAANPELERFDNPDTERKFSEALNGEEDNSGSIKFNLGEIWHGFKGDFPELAGNENFIFAREVLRKLGRVTGAKTQIAIQTLNNSLKSLNARQFNAFTRIMLLNDLYTFKRFNPGAALPLGFTQESLKAEREKFTRIAQGDSDILQAVNAEHKVHEAIKSELSTLADELGMKKFAEKVRRYDFYILDYARILKGGNVNANYITAMGDFRTKQLQDIERLKALKAIREKYDIKGKLQEKFGEQWGLHIPKSHRSFNPLAGRFIYSAHTLTDNILDIAIEQSGRELGMNDKEVREFKRRLSDNTDAKLLVLPNEIVDTLEELTLHKENGPIMKVVKAITSGWKKFVLFFPTRAFKYNLRNLTGDADALIAGNPKALAYSGRATLELWRAYFGNGEISPELKQFQERGGAITIENTQELGDYKQLKEFNNLMKQLEGKSAPAWRKLPANAWKLIDKFAWSGVQKFTDYREQILRYTCYLSYLEQMKKNNGSPDNWGASVPAEVMSLPDIRDRAFKMSNELLGAYDQVSKTGKSIRDFTVPFYSWLEVNAKRYYQLLKNGLFSDAPGDFTARFLKGQLMNAPYYAYKLGKTYFFVNLLTMLISAFNHLVWPDDEDKLPPDVQERPHITLGHDPSTGEVLYFERVGALLDNLEWFGQENSPFLPFAKDIRDILDGKQNFTDFVAKLVISPLNKAINAVNPIIKTPAELATGKSLYPDITRPRNISDAGRYIAQSLGLSWPYKAITDEPHSNWKEFKNLFAYSADADEAAYFYALGLVRQFSERVLGKKTYAFSSTRRGEVLRKLKTSLRLGDRERVQRYLREYYRLGGDSKGLKTSMRNMNPLHGLNKKEQEQFLRWLSQDDRKYFSRANKYFHQLADRFLR